MSGIGEAQAKIISGLKEFAPSLSPTDAGNISKAFFPIIDGVARFNPDQQNIVADVALDYAKGIHTARQNLNLDAKSNIALLRRIASEKLANADLSLPNKAFDGIDYAIQGDSSEEESVSAVKTKSAPAVNHTQQQAQDGINTLSEAADASEALADNSAELSNKSKLLAEIFNPITEVMLKLNPAQQKNFLDQLSDIFKSNKGEQGNFAPEALTDVKEKIAVLIKDYNPQALKEFVTNLDPAIKFELSSFFEQILKPGLEGGETLLRAGAVINNKFKPALVKVLESRIRANPEFETPSSEADLERIQAKKDFAMDRVIKMSKDLEAKLKQSPTYDVEAHFQRGLDSLKAELASKGEKLYASDLSLLSSHLKATKTVSQEKQQLDVANFLQKHSKIALMALPMILGPIASALSMIPIIGRPLAKLAPLVNNFATQFGPYMFMMFMNKGGGDKSSKTVEKAKDPDETPYRDLNQLQTAA
jgi:hypothetical protein